MAPALAQEKSYTIDDIYKLPEGSRAELIDGQIYYMAPPSRKHQDILSFLHLAIWNQIYLWSVISISLLITDATGLPTGLSRLYRLAAVLWITIQNCPCTVPPA